MVFLESVILEVEILILLAVKDVLGSEPVITT